MQPASPATPAKVGFGGGVVAAVEQDALAVVVARVAGDVGAEQCVERLDHPRIWGFADDYLAAGLDAEAGPGVDRHVLAVDLVELVGRVDQDPAAPVRQAAEGRVDVAAHDGQEHHLGRGGLGPRARAGQRAEGGHLLAQAVRSPAVGQRHRVAGAGQVAGDRVRDGAGADEYDLHAVLGRFGFACSCGQGPGEPEAGQGVGGEHGHGADAGAGQGDDEQAVGVQDPGV